MVKVNVKGNDINTINIRDSFNRRALQFSNNIINILKKLGISEYNIDVPLQVFAIKKASASVSWYFKGHHLYYSYNRLNNFVENLYVVFKVIEIGVNEIINKEKSEEEFIFEFSEDRDVEDKRKKAREVFELDHDVSDLDVINAKYKILAKECHPDMPNGNTEKFKVINHAHKMLKRELE